MYVCSETKMSEAEVIGDRVFMRVYPVFRGRLNTTENSMCLIWKRN